MQFLLGLVAGLIIGWIIEWIIDWQFWRVDPEQAQGDGEVGRDRLQVDLAQARAQIASLEAQLSSTDAETQPSSSEGAFTTAASKASTTLEPLAKPDDLTKIKGIGPVFARRLTNSGITTFAQLAQTTPDQVQEIVQAAEWQAIDPASWIAEAREMATSTGEGG